MVRLKGDKEIGDKINKIIGRLADENDLKGVIAVLHPRRSLSHFGQSGGHYPADPARRACFLRKIGVTQA
jgi:hypothetical protein